MAIHFIFATVKRVQWNSNGTMICFNKLLSPHCSVPFGTAAVERSKAEPMSVPTENSKEELNFNYGFCVDREYVITLSEQGRLKEALDGLHIMDQRGIQADAHTYRFLLQACINLKAAAEGYAQHGYPEEALILFHQMQRDGFKPNQYTFASVLRACASTGDLEQGKQILASIAKTRFQSYLFVESALVDMLSKSGSIEDARHVFDKMFLRDVVAWNAMITGYALQGHGDEALALFNEMQWADRKPDHFTFGSLLRVCGGVVNLKKGRQVHGCVIKAGFQSHAVVGSALVDMYAKCRSLDSARVVFDSMPEKDLISCTAMITGYTQQHGYDEEALRLFYEMRQAGMKPDHVTFSSVLSACASLAALEQGKRIHAHIIKSEAKSYVVLGNALVDMYAKSGRIEDARQVFDKMSERNMISWTAIITGYGKHGRGKEVIQLFEQMQCAGMEPNDITFLVVLSACSHSGLVDEAWYYFDSMSQVHCITPRAEHYACLVDLLGRAGCLGDAHDFINKVPFEPNASIWGALLGACRIHVNMELGKVAAERLFELDPQNSGNYVVLANIYAAAGRWEEAVKVRKLMKDRGIKKEPGCSWIEVKSRVYSFLVGDRSHSQSQDIFAMLERLTEQMKEEGYVPETNFVLHDVE